MPGTESSAVRRQRLHELLLALIAREDDLELLDAEGPVGLTGAASNEGPADAARWLRAGRNLRRCHRRRRLGGRAGAP